MEISGNATITLPDGSTSSEAQRFASNSFAAPLPVMGPRGAWAVAPQWLLAASGEFFNLAYDGIDGIDGSWFDPRARATWMFSRNFGLGLGYNRFSTNVDASANNFNGKLKSGDSGLQAYLTGTF